MSEAITPMTLIPIGVVKSPIKEPTHERLNLMEISSEIVINENLTEALDGIEGFSHIIVLYWMHRTTRVTRATQHLKGHPMGRTDVPEQGIFAVRTPHRPNPIGKSTIRLLERRGNILKVQGLDAIDGTPVIDIKPYIPGYDSARDATTPDWVVRDE